MPDRYSDMGGLGAFGFLANALDTRKGPDGDTNASFPRSDAEDMSRGARFIPGEVTMARRAGKKVNFMSECSPNCWYSDAGIRIRTAARSSRESRSRGAFPSGSAPFVFYNLL